MPSTSGNKNRERIFSTNKPIGIIPRDKKTFRLMQWKRLFLQKTLRYIRPIVLK
mgnify:CR=1 FL=1